MSRVTQRWIDFELGSSALCVEKRRRCRNRALFVVAWARGAAGFGKSVCRQHALEYAERWGLSLPGHGS